MSERLEKTIETLFGEVKVIIHAKAMVFVGQNITINRVAYVGRGHDLNLQDDGSWSFGSYTNLSLIRKDGKDPFSHSAMEKWGDVLVQIATELGTPENLKQAEWNETQNNIATAVAKQDELRKAIGELEEVATQLGYKKDRLELELRQIKRRAS